MIYTIAIDGHSSTGKSTYAKSLAKDLGWTHIDTGAMYRAITLYGLINFNEGHSINEKKVIAALKNIHLKFIYNPITNTNDIYLNDENFEPKIRDLKVSESVSTIAKIPEVRSFLVEKQRELGKSESIVMDGRDIGTVVFPNADLKFFITASIDIRAQRRYLELKNKSSIITYEEVKENLIKRDYIDEHRILSPLKMAENAYLIDNTFLDKEQTYRKIKQIVISKINL
ncbi:(d)CMP kinase [Apibacter muscae]|uniref:(d)CMP kinase n=1 Tax=Apibacter muscae TaxID=2509004 RepID=UPI0011ABB0A5|nr:(d)CMP kinase [Apibacter muscae]TWP22569.1 (d)CMP kinase [Apibacter muscae]TWP27598.1 (d)CMP kinase [Apibacter muscae]